MHATRTRAVVALAVLALAGAGAPGCGADETSSGPSCSECGGEGGSGDGAGAGVAGDSVSASGSSMQPSGGAGASGGGAAPGSAGTSDVVGGQGGTAGADAIGGEAGGGASSGDDGEQLQICARLANGADDALTVQSAYTSALYEDCRVRWLFPSGQAFIDLVNQLRRFSFQFWGCPGTPRVYTFALVSGTPALSQGDANLLIEHYLVAAQAAVDLTSLERTEMQAALARLAKPLIVDSSLDPSKPACAGGGDAGGAGGAGGIDAGGSGGSSGAAAGVGGTL